MASLLLLAEAEITRVAAVFHCIEGYEGASISLETLRSASAIVLWYAKEFVRLFSPPDPLHETIKDAYLLQDWLLKIYRTRNWQVIPKNFILQQGPNSFRSKDRLDWALNCLDSGARISGSTQGRKTTVRKGRSTRMKETHCGLPTNEIE